MTESVIVHPRIARLSKPHEQECMKTPTPRQVEYLAFISAFSERFGVSPSFGDIARHFLTSSPSVNGMVKALEARGFIARVPGQARTLRVVIPGESFYSKKPPSKTTTAPQEQEIRAATNMASLVIERLVPALQGERNKQLWSALDAVAAALRAACLAAGASKKQQDEAQDTIHRIALIAQGMNPDAGPRKSRAIKATDTSSNRSNSNYLLTLKGVPYAPPKNPAR